ncbi:hypothetical protein M6B38_276740 [Iris pallida]|uniref:Uncharacterized protein n=1 Tax=Iris pallida TaxID=29817 RepID=A0AAX6I3Z8_IRIPA|nr:hypothetical protein M6B38_276740 [Iris pallida]
MAPWVVGARWIRSGSGFGIVGEGGDALALRWGGDLDCQVHIRGSSGGLRRNPRWHSAEQWVQSGRECVSMMSGICSKNPLK